MTMSYCPTGDFLSGNPVLARTPMLAVLLATLAIHRYCGPGGEVQCMGPLLSSLLRRPFGKKRGLGELKPVKFRVRTSEPRGFYYGTLGVRGGPTRAPLSRDTPSVP